MKRWIRIAGLEKRIEARDAILEFEIAYDFVIANAQSKKKNQDRMRIKSWTNISQISLS